MIKLYFLMRDTKRPLYQPQKLRRETDSQNAGTEQAGWTTTWELCGCQKVLRFPSDFTEYWLCEKWEYPACQVKLSEASKSWVLCVAKSEWWNHRTNHTTLTRTKPQIKWHICPNTLQFFSTCISLCMIVITACTQFCTLHFLVRLHYTNSFI